MSSVESGALPSVRDELERRFQRDGRIRLRRFCVTLLLVVVILCATFDAYFRLQYGTFAWWNAPPRIPYCGLSYVRAPQGTVSRSSPGKLDQVTSVPPLFRAVYASPVADHDGIGSSQSCSVILYFQTGSGTLIEYAYPTA